MATKGYGSNNGMRPELTPEQARNTAGHLAKSQQAFRESLFARSTPSSKPGSIPGIPDAPAYAHRAVEQNTRQFGRIKAAASRTFGRLKNKTGAAFEAKVYSGFYSKNPKKQAKAANQYTADRARRGLMGTSKFNDGTSLPKVGKSTRGIPGLPK